MLGVAFAMVAVVSWAVAALFVRLGLMHMRPLPGTLWSLVTGLALLLILGLVVHGADLFTLSFSAFLLFAVIGVLNFPMGRYFTTMSINYLGVARSTPPLATGPFFGVLLAIIFLGDRPTALVSAGVLLIIGGILLAVTEEHSA